MGEQKKILFRKSHLDIQQLMESGRVGDETLNKHVQGRLNLVQIGLFSPVLAFQLEP